MGARETDLADAIHHIRERALRQAMAMVNRLQPTATRAASDAMTYSRLEQSEAVS